MVVVNTYIENKQYMFFMNRYHIIDQSLKKLEEKSIVKNLTRYKKITITLPPISYKKLVRMAKKEERTISNMIATIIDRVVEDG